MKAVSHISVSSVDSKRGVNRFQPGVSLHRPTVVVAGTGTELLDGEEQHPGVSGYLLALLLRAVELAPQPRRFALHRLRCVARLLLLDPQLAVVPQLDIDSKV